MNHVNARHGSALSARARHTIKLTPAHLIRPAGLDDLAVLSRHRGDMFRAMGYRDEPALEAMEAAFERWVTVRIERGEYLAWLVVDQEGEPIAGAGVWLMDWLPHMVGPGAPRANVVNVFVEPEWRRRGIARELMNTVLEACRERGARPVIPHASADGRALYESLGFAPTNEMRLIP